MYIYIYVFYFSKDFQREREKMVNWEPYHFWTTLQGMLRNHGRLGIPLPLATWRPPRPRSLRARRAVRKRHLGYSCSNRSRTSWCGVLGLLKRKSEHTTNIRYMIQIELLNSFCSIWFIRWAAGHLSTTFSRKLSKTSTRELACAGCRFLECLSSSLLNAPLWLVGVNLSPHPPFTSVLAQHSFLGS